VARLRIKAGESVQQKQILLNITAIPAPSEKK
jgi:hypothetical protein